MTIEVSALLQVMADALEQMKAAEYRWLVHGEHTAAVQELHQNAYARHEAAKAVLRHQGVEV